MSYSSENLFYLLKMILRFEINLNHVDFLMLNVKIIPTFAVQKSNYNYQVKFVSDISKLINNEQC